MGSMGIFSRLGQVYPFLLACITVILNTHPKVLSAPTFVKHNPQSIETKLDVCLKEPITSAIVL